MKKLLILFSLLLSLQVSCKKDDGGSYSDDETIELTSVVLSNGDIVEYDSSASVNSVDVDVLQSGSYKLTISSELKDYYFSFSAAQSSLYFMVTSYAPSDNSDWRLCKYNFEKDVWIDLDDVTYSSESGSYKATVALSEDTSSAIIGENYTVVRLGFIKTSELIKNVEIVENPSTHNALSALVKFNTSENVTPTMTLYGQDNNNIIKSFDNSLMHEINVLGLYNNYNNEIHIDCVTSDGFTICKEVRSTPNYSIINGYDITTSFDSTFTNDPSDIYCYTGFIGTADSTTDDYGYFVNSVGVDMYGKIRWVFSKSDNAGKFFPITYSGIGCIAHFNDDGDGWKDLNIIDRSGNYVKVHQNAIFRGHHDAANYEIDGKNMVLVPEQVDGSIEDECMFAEIDLDTGARIQTYNLDNIIDPDRESIVSETVDRRDDRVHINSVAYDATDDTYVISARHQGVMKIRRGATDKSGLVWWMTPHYNVATDWEGYLLTPTNFVNDHEEWNIGQHTATILPNGDIMMFDNHNPPTEDADDAKRISRVLVMRVDENNMEIQKVHDWTTPDSGYSQYMSSAYYQNDMNSIVAGWATLRRAYEYDYESGTQLFQCDFNTINVTGSLYRYYKMNLYE